MDTRPGAARRTRTLTGWRAAAYVECDRAISVDRLRQRPFLAGVGDAELRDFLDECAAEKLMLCHRGQALSLAVHDEPCPPSAFGDETERDSQRIR